MAYPIAPSRQQHVSLSTCLDDRQRTDLLCHLVVEQLQSRASSGIWLSLDSAVECIQRWSKTKAVASAWLDAARVNHFSEQLASDLWQIRHLRSATRIASLRTAQGMLDNDSPFVRRMYAVCESRLLAHGMVEPRTLKS
ncbi:hypothetical protein PSAB6_270122 [Paraburkholderia sabiae]|nr:hypothetical protein PSAB6_270122 [Paraburkholderia sabiae]